MVKNLWQFFALSEFDFCESKSLLLSKNILIPVFWLNKLQVELGGYILLIRNAVCLLQRGLIFKLF